MLGQRKESPYVVTEERTDGIPGPMPEPNPVDAMGVNKTREGPGEEGSSVEDGVGVGCAAIKP